MASNHHHHPSSPPEGLGDDFFEQILGGPSFGGDGSDGAGGSSMGLQLRSVGAEGSGFRGMGPGMGIGMGMPLGLNLEHAFLKPEEGRLFRAEVDANTYASSSSATSGINERESVHLTSLFPAFGHLQTQSVRPTPPPPPAPPGPPPLPQPFHGQPTPRTVSAAPHPPSIRPRARARRGQATDPHSIAERLRRERIAERMRALQDLVPVANKADRAAMLDEIVDYVKFLRLQVKVLSMSRLGGAGCSSSACS
ncbi:hypothetical protein L1049_021005 [Liquidambar formosana]|uniref:BHLH domain-containing protein n=1 Tax=Liquidambar formosana TaxID=63359 RepID=A0AAP0X6L1_LIQFO